MPEIISDHLPVALQDASSACALVAVHASTDSQSNEIDVLETSCFRGETENQYDDSRHIELRQTTSDT